MDKEFKYFCGVILGTAVMITAIIYTNAAFAVNVGSSCKVVKESVCSLSMYNYNTKSTQCKAYKTVERVFEFTDYEAPLWNYTHRTNLGVL